MKIEIFEGNWKISDIKNNPDKIFIFGDNDARLGKGGQAIIRDLPNTMGIRTKKGPSKKTAAYYKDSDFKNNAKKILEDILEIKTELMKGTTIVLAQGGYGTGLASLKEKAPKTFEYLCFLLKEHFHFNNETGQSWYKIPGHNEISNGFVVSLDNKGIIQPINNSQFRTEHLGRGLNTVSDLIVKGKKSAFTMNRKFNNGDVLILEQNKKIAVVTSSIDIKEKVVCRVIESYNASEISDINWSIYEGFDTEFIKSKEKKGYQTHFQFICTLDNKGKMAFKNEIFTDKKKVSSSKVKEKKEESKKKLDESENVKKIYKEENKDTKMSKPVSNEEIYEILKRIESKLERKRFRLFKKKTMRDLVASKIKGEILEIKEINSPLSSTKYEVKVQNGDKISYTYINYSKGFFSNKVEIILTSDNQISLSI